MSSLRSGVVSIPIQLQVEKELTCFTDWAGGPGDSAQDVEWLDNKLSQFFAENEGGSVNSLAGKLQNTL